MEKAFAGMEGVEKASFESVSWLDEDYMIANRMRDLSPLPALPEGIGCCSQQKRIQHECFDWRYQKEAMLAGSSFSVGA